MQEVSFDFHTKDIRAEEVIFKLMNSQLCGIQEYGILIQPGRIPKKITIFTAIQETNLQCTYVHPQSSSHSHHKQCCLPPSLTQVPLHQRPVEFVTMLQNLYWKSRPLIHWVTKEDSHARTRVKCIVLTLYWVSVIDFLMPTNFQVWAYFFNEHKNGALIF